MIGAENYLHPAIRKEINNLEERRVKLTQLSPHYACVEAIAEELFSYHSMWTYSGSIQLNFYVNAYTDSIPLLTALAHAGWKRIGKMEKTCASFKWKLEYEARPGLMIPLEVSGDVRGEDAEGATCRRVQVGTKTSEIPIYEIQCDDPAEASALAN